MGRDVCRAKGATVADFLKAFDNDGSYTLEKRELAQALEHCGIVLSAKQYTAIFRRADRDNSGGIDIDEFQAAVDRAADKFERIDEVMIQLQETLEERNMRAVDFVREFDDDGSGALGLAEFRSLFKKLGIELNEAELRLVYDRLDIDGGGSVDAKELQRNLKAAVDAARMAHEREEAAADQEQQEHLNRMQEAEAAMLSDSRTKMAAQDTELIDGNFEDDGTGRRRPDHAAKGLYGVVSVRSLTRTFAYEVGFDDLVDDLKCKIAVKEGIPVVFQRLAYSGRELANGKTLGDCGLVPGCVVQLSQATIKIADHHPNSGHGPGRAGGWTSGAPSPGSQNGTYKKPKYRKDLGGIYPRNDAPTWGVKYAKVQVRTLRGKVITLDVRLHDTVKMLKAQIQDREGVPIASQRITYNNVTLKDERLFVDCHVTPGAVLQLQGLAAGHAHDTSRRMPYAATAALHDEMHLHDVNAERHMRLGYPNTYRM